MKGCDGYYDPATEVYVSKSTKPGDLHKEIRENVEKRKKNALELRIDEKVESILGEFGRKEVISISEKQGESYTITSYGNRKIWIGAKKEEKNKLQNEVKILMYWGGLVGYIAGWRYKVYHSKNDDSSNKNVLRFKDEEKWLGKLDAFYKKAARSKAERELKGKEMNLAGVIYENIEDMDNFGIHIAEERRRIEEK